MDKGLIKNLITALGFIPMEGMRDVYAKTYTQHNEYSISVDFKSQSISYVTPSVEEAKSIVVSDTTTSNFAKWENFVVLECVNRLLEKGYAPSCIELERRYPLGRREKGRLDILVKEPDGTPYILIECKTWGTEYDKEQLLMNRTGGQLFSYYANERAAKYLCLYTSKVDGTTPVYHSAIVPVETDWTTLSGTKEILAAWNGSFKNNGIFEMDRTPYNVTHTALTYRELQTITEEHSEKIFDFIMEILRHNVVSDKPNAFNKLLNLFVCKIIDEDRQPDDVVDFQLLDSDGKYDLQMRLNDLYQKGMLRFLNIRVTDYSEQEIEELTAIDDETKRKELKEAITKLRLQKNPEFAFLEVCDEKTFEANDKILREIVCLLQAFKFRYAQKHQFLGDFFELLLSTSIKQESGQFFTPPPITRFVLAALPLQSRVNFAVESGDIDFLPTVIDYACGSGHFLTEYLERMQNIVDTVDVSKAKPSIQRMVRQYQEDGKFSWADKYVYGIDLDYRLVKTTKVSAFFNGDGEAKIVWANGLSNFAKTPEYLDKLRYVSKIDKHDNASFDILISNPPYSVEAFKSTLDDGDETFELFDELTDKSKEIECLFVERMKQLLKPGGWAGVILPTSLMTNSSIHAKAREILFKYFRFKAIAEMGSNTFMKTGTNTVILFLERRENTDWQIVYRAVEKFFTDKQDVTILGVEEPFSMYALKVRGESFAEYLNFIKTANREMINVEKDKLLYFILTYSQTIVLVKSGQKQVEKEFLGYEFSERRGREGLRPLINGGKLFDENDFTNPTKVSSYIYNAFLHGTVLPVHADVVKHVSYERLSSLINYTTSVWNKQIFLVRKKSGVINNQTTSSLNMRNLGNIAPYVLTRVDISALNADNYVGVENLLPNIGGRIKSNFVPTSGNVTAFEINDILLSNIRPYLKKIWFADRTGGCSNDVLVLRVVDNQVLPKYLYYLLSENNFFEYEMDSIGSNVKMPRADKAKILEYQVPILPIDVQRLIISEYEAVEKESKPIALSIEENKINIEQLFLDAQHYANDVYSLADEKIFMVTIGKRVLKEELISVGQFPIYSANVIEPFGYTNKLLIADFSVPSVLWGIDGDWIVSYMPENIQFYPTDHCGVLRVLANNIHPRYLTWVLGKAGEVQEFSRNRRASVDRIKSLSVSLPSFTVQKRTAREVFELEQKIANAKRSLEELDSRRKCILDKYL